MALLRQRIA